MGDADLTTGDPVSNRPRIKSKPSIERLIFSGGGAKGFAHIGALRYLDDVGVLDTVTKVAGTSAGAVVAALFACGYSASELFALATTTPMSTWLEDDAVVCCYGLALLWSWGLYSGDRFERAYETLLLDKLNTSAYASTSSVAPVSFQDMFDATGIHLKIVATNLSTESVTVYDSLATPDTSVTRAVRASISAPPVFIPVRAPEGLLVDGGLVINYPLYVFGDTAADLEKTIGLKLMGVVPNQGIPGSASQLVSESGPLGLAEYVKAIVSTLLEATENLYIRKRYWARTIPLRMDHPSFDFDVTLEQIGAIVDSGYDQARRSFFAGPQEKP